MLSWLKKNWKEIGLHMIFWVGVWFLYYYFFSYNSNVEAYVLWFSSGLLPLTMGVTYWVVYRLMPKYLFTKQYGKLLLNSFYVLVFSSYFIVLLIYACLIFVLDFNIRILPPMSKNFFFILLLVFLVVGIVSFITVLSQKFRSDSKNQELQNKILQAQLQMKNQELQYLKMQIHPHFLFNTLNTIYGLALRQSRQTPDVILKLSNLLDYILYQINKPHVGLYEEMMHIREYIDLERIRFEESLNVDLQMDDIPESIQIAPMLLIPFVENAFKHGQILAGFLSIKIGLSISDQSIEFSVENSSKSYEKGEAGEGIGLENIKRRLDLHYKNQYTLDIRQRQDSFRVNLRIDPVKMSGDE